MPEEKEEMENLPWFNMWQREHFPYSELQANDIIYWYESVSQKFVWKTRVIEINRFWYEDKEEVFAKYNNPRGNKYYETRPQKGFCMHYKVLTLKKLDHLKPYWYVMPRIGWDRATTDLLERLFGQGIEIDENSMMDDFIHSEIKNPLSELAKLNDKMKDVSLERINRMVALTLRQDTRMIRKLKEIYGFNCQYPGCKASIRMKNGKHYVEVAHIKPVREGGKSILGNLLVLCPNHHKEFDLGDLKIIEQLPIILKGTLNGLSFEINFELSNVRK